MPVPDNVLNERRFAQALVEGALEGAEPEGENARELASRWAEHNNNLVFLPFAQKIGTVDDVAEKAGNARAEYLAEAAARRREIEMAVESMERSMARQVYRHEYCEDEELEGYAGVGAVYLAVELGEDEDGGPVVLDFAETPHLIEVRGRKTGRSLGDVVAAAVHRREGVRCVFIDSAMRDRIPGKVPPRMYDCVVPPATDPFSIAACIDWLQSELDLRQRLSFLDIDAGPLFVFAEVGPDGRWLFDSDGLGLIAEYGRSLNMHLVVGAEYSIHDRVSGDSRETVEDLTDMDDGAFAVAVREGSDYADLYRLLSPDAFVEWLDGFGDAIRAGAVVYSSARTVVVEGVGRLFVAKAPNVREAVLMEQTAHDVYGHPNERNARALAALMRRRRSLREG